MFIKIVAAVAVAVAAFAVPVAVPAVHANPPSGTTVMSGSYWFPPHNWLCKKMPYLAPLC